MVILSEQAKARENERIHWGPEFPKLHSTAGLHDDAIQLRVEYFETLKCSSTRPEILERFNVHICL